MALLQTFSCGQLLCISIETPKLVAGYSIFPEPKFLRINRCFVVYIYSNYCIDNIKIILLMKQCKDLAYLYI